MTESSRFRPVLRIALFTLLSPLVGCVSPGGDNASPQGEGDPSLSTDGDAAFEGSSGIDSSGKIMAGGEITKVKYYLLNVKDRAQMRAVDPMIRNERSRRLYGAITPLEQRAREGHYYTVFWRTDDPLTPATVKMEYRQGDVVDEILVKQVEVDPAGEESHTTDFEVIGEEYKDDGEVLAFRFSVEQNGQVIADDKSYLWE